MATLKASQGVSAEQLANLQRQIEYYKQLLELQKERTQLEHDRAEFYREQGQAKDSLIKQHEELEAKLEKEAEKKSFWKAMAIGEILLMIGLAIGIAL